jgi:hypothetical protein
MFTKKYEMTERPEGKRSICIGISKVIDDAREYLANRATGAGGAHLGETGLQKG